MKRQILIISLVLGVLLPLQAQSVKDLKMDAYGNLWAKHYKAALSAFNKLFDATSPEAEDYLGRGIANYHLGNSEDALYDLSQSSAMGTSEAELWKARLYVAQNRPKEAVNALNAYISENTDADLIAIKRDSTFRKLHSTDEWFLLWQDINDDLSEIATETRYYSTRNNFQEAHRVVEGKLHAGLDDGILYALNASLYQEEGNLPLALNEINHAISADPVKNNYLVQKAEYLNQAGQHAQAYAILDKLVNSDYTNFTYRYKRAQFALASGHLDIAGDDIALILEYSDAPEFTFLATEIAYADGDYISALKTCNKLLEKDSANAAYLKVRGMTYYQTRTYKQAAYDLSMSLDLQPVDPETNYYKGLSEYALGNSKMACYYMDRAIRKNYQPAIEFSTRNCKK